MAHRVDDANYTTVSGQRRFKDSPIPGTTFSENMANMFQEEIVRIVELAGLTPAASAAADQAAGWSQLGEAVRILSQRKVSGNAQFTGSTLSYSPSIDIAVIHLTDDGGGPYNNATLTLATNNPTRDAGREIFIINLTAEPKRISFSSGHATIVLQPASGCFVYGRNSSGATVWYPSRLDEITDLTASVTAQTDGAEGTTSAFDIHILWNRQTNLVTILFPVSVTIATVTNPYGHARLSALPSNLNPPAYGVRTPILLANDAGVELGYCAFQSFGILAFYKADGTNFVQTSSTTIYFPQSLTFEND